MKTYFTDTIFCGNILTYKVDAFSVDHIGDQIAG